MIANLIVLCGAVGAMLLGLGLLGWAFERGRRGPGASRSTASQAALPTAPPPLSLSQAERRRYQHSAAMARCVRDAEVSADFERQAAEYLAKIWPDKADELLPHRGSRA